MKARHEAIAFSELLEGQDVRGGCLDCDAFQRLVKSDEGVWDLTTYHDNSCPFLLARNARSN